MEDNSSNRQPIPSHLVPINQYNQNEISLIELWLVLTRRKWAFFVMFFVIFILSLTYALLLKPVYEVHATIKIGQIDGHFIEPVDNVVAHLSSVYMNPKKKSKMPHIESIKKQNNLVEVIADGYNINKTQELLNGLTKELVERHQQLFAPAVDQLKAQVEASDRNLAEFKRQAAKLELAKQRVANISGSQAAIVELEKSRLLAETPRIEQEKSKILISLSPINTYPTELLPITDSDFEATNSKTTLYIILGIILASVLGLISAFFIEFISVAHKEMRLRNDERSA